MEPNDSPAPEPMPPAAENPPPLRLSILHLFLWMTGTAVLLAVQQGNERQVAGRPVWEVAFFHGLQFFSAIVDGIPLASLALLIQHGFVRPARFPRQPGHWLLIALGLTKVVLLPFLIALAWKVIHQQNWDFEELLQYLCIATAACSLVWGIVLLVAACSLDKGAWRAVLAIGAAGSLLQAIVSIVLMLAARFTERLSLIPQLNAISFTIEVTYLLFVGLTLFPIIAEWRKRRDFLHSVGVTVLYLSASRAAILLLWRFIRPML